MGKLISLISALLMAVGSAFAVAPSGYEWWFDNDVSTLQSGSLSPEKTDLIIDTSQLPKGAHYFNCRLNTSEGEWGSVYRKMFFAIGQDSGEISYEYWFDNDYGQKTVGDISSGTSSFDVDVATLSPGVHYFNCRLTRGTDDWGSIYRKMFFTVSNDMGAVAYEYWIDNDHDNKVEGDISKGMVSIDIELGDLTPGAHYFNCRLYTNDGGWGSVYRKMVFTTPTGNEAVAYEYWLDDNYEAKATGAMSQGANSYVVDLDGLKKGMHRFNYRLQTGQGEWGSVYSKYFYYSSSSTLPFTSYEYWLDNDYANRVSATATTNPVTFDIDLDGFDKSGGAHYFTMRVRDDDGEWSSFYRRLVVFHDADKHTPVIGYRHYLNGTDLGFVKVERQITDKYTFLTELPDSMRLSIRDKKPLFDGDMISLEGTDSIHYIMQIQSELGWAPPQSWDLEVSNPFTTTAVEMAVNSMHGFDTPITGRFAAVKFTATGAPLYFRSDMPIALDLYRNGEKVGAVTAADLYQMQSLTLEAGEYFGLLYDAEALAAGDEIPGSFTFHLLDTPNMAPAPVIDFKNGLVYMSCSRDDAEIHYVVQDYLSEGTLTPDLESPKFDLPFTLDHNAVIKAFAVVPNSDIAPSAIVEYVVNSFRVEQPQIAFTHLQVIITPDTRSGVRTFYTLSGNSAQLSDNLLQLAEAGSLTNGVQEYSAPFSFMESGKVMARSYREGYNPSSIAEYSHNHSAYITGTPQISVDGTTVTIKETTAGSVIYYAIDNPDTGAMTVYNDKFTMEGNGTIYAQARKADMYDSPVVSYEINGRKMPKPRILVDGNFMVMIQCDHDPATVYYTLDGSSPTNPATRNEFTVEFKVDRNCVIKAMAVDPTGNLDDSDIEELVIDSYQMPEPQISFEHLQVVIDAFQIDGARTFYTLSGNIDLLADNVPALAETGSLPNGVQEYTAPFSYMESGKIMARSYREGYHPSTIAEYSHNHAAYITGAPQISVDGTTVHITETTAGSTIYYAIDNSDPASMAEYEGDFTMEGNGTIYAQARKADMYDSSVVSYEINGRKMPKPAIRVNGHMVKIECDRDPAVIYYTLDDSSPTNPATRNEYTGEFEFDRNGVIKAIAIDPNGNLDDSEIGELVINDNQVAPPQITFEHLQVVIRPDTRSGVRTFYTLSGNSALLSDNLLALAESGSLPTGVLEYSAPFSYMESGRVMARSYREGYNPSTIAEYSHNHAAYITGAPQIAVAGKTVTLTRTTAGSSLWYAIGNANPSAMTEYNGAFDVDGNVTVYAQARMTDMYDSEVVSRAVTGLKADMPSGQFDPETKLLTLTCGTTDARISYSVNSQGNWTDYSAPILIEGNCIVYAKANAPNYLESDVAEITVSEFKCADVRISYNGRYVTLETDEPDAEIRYTFGDGNPAGGETYGGEPVDAGGLGTVRAVTVKPDFMDSEIAEYRIAGYADEEHAETADEGVLESCFVWNGRDILDNSESFRFEGKLNATDYALIRSMKSLRHLDLENVVDAVLPDRAVADIDLISVSLPANMVSAGDSILGSNFRLSAVIWNSTEVKADGVNLGGISNPNLLLYLPTANAAEDNLGVIRNRIVNGHAASILLTDGKPFHAPRTFSADEISYTRHFSKQTVIGECSGWETLTVPFEVERVQDAVSEIIPFAVAGDDDRPFWLYRPIGTGWQRTDRIMANEPYLISMPNNPDYIESFNIRGDVVFSASNAEVPATPETEGVPYKSGAELWGNYMPLKASDDLWVINDEWLEGAVPGSVFARGIRDVRPFECYLTSDASGQRMPVFDTTELEQLMAEMGMSVWCENHDLCILSGMSRKVRIHDTVGQLVRLVEVEAGTVSRVSDLAPGIYLVDRVKIMVR